MGGGSFTPSSWSGYTSSRGYTPSSTVDNLYKARTINTSLEPKGVKFRESCDSVEHPHSSPIIVGLDVTGSMGSMLEATAKKLNVLFTEVYKRQPVSDPQIMFMGIGDVKCDSHPLQVSQFESDIRVAEQLNDLYFERGGGGNGGESYPLAWYFAARHTKIDSFDKHGRKGFLFTIGDENFHKTLERVRIKEFIGDDLEADLTAEELLNEVSRQYEVYHLMVGQGGGMVASQHTEVVKNWTNLMGERAILVSDVDKIPEVIVSILEVEAGKDVDTVTASWDGSTAVVVHNAIKGLKRVQANGSLIEF